MNSAEDIVAFLDEEYRVLTDGRLSEIPGLITRKEALHDALSVSPVTKRDQLEKIAQMAERNAGLIEAARQGIFSAISEISDIRQGLNQTTYSQNGKRQPLSTTPHKVERKV